MTVTEQEPGGANGINLDGSNISLKEFLTPETNIELEALCARVHTVIENFIARDTESALLHGVQEKTRDAIRVIAKALDTYGLAQISLSYNGGKDCLVLLVLYLHGLYDYHTRHIVTDQPGPTTNTSTADLCFRSIQSVYIKTPHPFHEVESFVQDSERAYSLTLSRYTTPMKAAFASYLADHPLIQAIFVGTRRTDPHGAALTHFDETDHGWPKFMRIHPVIDWHYVEIWSFIKHFNIPYCHLYDMGYTSLGGTNDTRPNPALRLPGSTPLEPKFRPAHELVLDEEERLGGERGEPRDGTLPPEEKRHLF